MKETIFKQIINYITECQDTVIKDGNGEIEEKGMSINEKIWITTDIHNQEVFIRNGWYDTFTIRKEDEYLLLALKELFSDMERDAEYSYESTKTTQEVEVQEQSNKVTPLSNSDFVTEIATNIAKAIKETDESTLAHVSITRENCLTTVTLDGNKLHGVRSVAFTQEAGGLPILNVQLACEQVSIDSPCLMHIPAIYRDRMSHKE